MRASVPLPVFLLAGSISFATSARAIPMECVVKGSPETVVQTVMTGTGEKRARHGGETLLGFIWDGVFEVFRRAGDEYEDIGEFLFEADFDCDGPGKTADFPIVITDQSQLNEFGIATDFFSDNTALAIFDHECFDIGGGQTHFSLSDERVVRYERRGVSFDNLCLASGSGQIRFNPETGERLPTFVMLAEWDGVWVRSFEFLLDVPDCFGRGQEEISYYGDQARLQPLGCDIRFHPWAGRPMSPDETAFFNARAFLHIEGSAGGSTLDGNDLAADSNRRATAARIEALKLMLAK